MPTYAFEFSTDRGPQSAQFTLDDDRPLQSQINRVIEEIRLSGAELRGRHDERLTVVWNGTELDAARTPRELRLTPDRPIQLRMVGQRRKLHVTEPPVEPFLPKGGYAGALTGAGGALLAWLIATLVDVLGGGGILAASPDVTMATLLGGTIGGIGFLGMAARGGLSGPLGLLVGTTLGAVGGAAGGAASVGAAQLASHLPWQAFVIGRIAAWVVFGAILGTVLGARWARQDLHRLADGMRFGALGGGCGGLCVTLLPGPADFWLIVAAMLLGAGIGYALCGPALRRAAAILDLESVEGKPIGLSGLLEWVVDEGTEVPLTERVTVGYEGGTCQLRLLAESASAPVETVMVGGRVAEDGMIVRNGDRLDVDGWRLRFRRVRSVSA
jgi:hypothetical protein